MNRHSSVLLLAALFAPTLPAGCDQADETAPPTADAATHREQANRRTGEQAKDAPQAPSPKSQASSPLGWPMYRGDRRQTGVAPGQLTVPLEWRWTFKATASITSSPVVADGRAYIGSDDGFLYAVNLQDGSLAWKFETEDAIEAPPMVLDGVVYVGSSDGRLYAVDAKTGVQRWRFETDDKVLSGVNWFDAPPPLNRSDGIEEVRRAPRIDLVAGHRRLVFGSYDNTLYCLDAGGELVWKYETENYINGTPAIDGERIVFGGCDSYLHVVNAQEGTAERRLPLGEECYVAGSIGLADGAAYFGHYGNAFVCIDSGTGETRWTYHSREGFFSAPAIGEDRVVFGGRDKQVHCVNRATGEMIWTFATRRQVDSSPVLCDGKVIVGSGDGLLYVLDSATGSELWSYDLGKSIVSSPAVVDGLVLIGCNDGGLYAFGPRRSEAGR